MRDAVAASLHAQKRLNGAPQPRPPAPEPSVEGVEHGGALRGRLVQQVKNCGAISDGCGGTLTCGACTAPQSMPAKA